MYLGRNAEGAFQTLAVDLRKLRNVLEDIEEATPDESHRRVLAQIPQCKAILLGLDLTLLSENSQPQSVLAAKASIQVMTNCLTYALDDIPTCSQQEGDLTQNMPAKVGAARRSTPSNDVAQSTDASSAATNTSSSNRSSADVVGLASGQLPKTSVISLQAIVEGKRALKPISHRDATSKPADMSSVDWRPSFALDDSVSFHEPRACKFFTARLIRPQPVIPRIAVNDYDGEVPTADMLEESSCSDTDGSKSSGVSDRSEDLHGSTAFTRSQFSRVQAEHNVSLTAHEYVPYRPWYCTTDPSTPVAENFHNLINEDDTFALQEVDNERSTNGVADKAPLQITTNNILHANPPPTVPYLDIKHEHRPVLSKQTETSHAVPLMPARPPPRPPTTRNKRKPPVPPPRRRLLQDVNPSLSAKEGLLATSKLPASAQGASTVGSQTRSSADIYSAPPILVDSQDLLNRNLIIRQRASTGDLEIRTTHTHPKAKYHRDRLLQGLRQPGSGIDMRLSRPASTPELKTSEPGPRISSVVLEQGPQTSPPSADNRTAVRFDDKPCDLREALQDMRAVEAKRIRDICESLNSRQWAKAESYLTYHLNTLKGSADSECARRIRHLLGVCASYRGHWRQVLDLFISVVRTPIIDTSKLDDGDRAASYWLADTYALLGRTREALLAYCLAGSCGRSTSSSGQNSSWRCLLAEQRLLRHAVSDAAYEAVCADDSLPTSHAANGQLLHSDLVSQDVSKACFQACSARAEEDDCEFHDRSPHSSNPTRPDRPQWYQMHISPLHFEHDQIWPLAQDTTFSTAAVTQARILPRETDFFKAAQNHPETLLPGQSLSFPISRTSPGEGLTHLIPALRETLRTLSMGWTEVCSPREVGFMVAYTAIENGITTMNYFKLEIVRIPFSAECGVVFCSGKTSTSSARITSQLSRIGKRLASVATRKAVKACLRTTLTAICERRCVTEMSAAAAANSSKLLPPLPPSMMPDLPVQPLPLPVVPAPAPAPTPTPPSPSPSPSPSPPPSSRNLTTTTRTAMTTTTMGTSVSLHGLESSPSSMKRTLQ